MDADLRNHINKGMKTFEVFQKLKQFIDEFDSIEAKAAEQRKYIDKFTIEINSLNLIKDATISEIENLKIDAKNIIEKAKEESLTIKADAEYKKADMIKKAKEQVDKSILKLKNIENEHDEINKILIPLRKERDSIASEIEAAKEKFRKMF